jgi:hypothetical protein
VILIIWLRTDIFWDMKTCRTMKDHRRFGVKSNLGAPWQSLTSTSTTLKMKVVYSFETSVGFYRTTRNHIPDVNRPVLKVTEFHTNLFTIDRENTEHRFFPPVQAVEVLRVTRGWDSHIFSHSAHRCAARLSAMRAGHTEQRLVIIKHRVTIYFRLLLFPSLLQFKYISKCRWLVPVARKLLLSTISIMYELKPLLLEINHVSRCQQAGSPAVCWQDSSTCEMVNNWFNIVADLEIISAHGRYKNIGSQIKLPQVWFEWLSLSKMLTVNFYLDYIITISIIIIVIISFIFIISLIIGKKSFFYSYPFWRDRPFAFHFLRFCNNIVTKYDHLLSNAAVKTFPK